MIPHSEYFTCAILLPSPVCGTTCPRNSGSWASRSAVYHPFITTFSRLSNIMDSLQIELAKLRRDANLSKSIEDVDSIIEQLERAREAIVSGMDSAVT